MTAAASTGSRVLCLSVVIGAHGTRAVKVRLPYRQGGSTAYLGRLGDGLVAKFLKVDDLRRALHTGAAGGRPAEPLWAEPLRHLPLPDNPFRPTRAQAARLRYGHDRAVARICAITPDAADAVLRRTAPRLPATRRHLLVDQMFGTRAAVSFAPEPSVLTTADFPELGIVDVPTLLQQDVGPRIARALPTEPGAAGAALAVLLGLAQTIAEDDGIGLDVVPRPSRRGLVLPNVLLRPAGPVYVDFFGLGDPAGGLVERAGHRVLYGGARPAAALAARTAATAAARLAHSRDPL
ncbi:hypothetical protein [Streptomyces sp. PanSC9]|uniref:hypothetical protein n=1 Tax=Streptomyces sp. PanSC9 TaxID=1520461 RepID=UPI000F494D58|nr:hypothetical protein [Streptomyces sp. PanSC9]ROP47648.1 hypothetical protein EDD94_7347 [Streptomyces sp. PanSC9]